MVVYLSDLIRRANAVAYETRAEVHALSGLRQWVVTLYLPTGTWGEVRLSPGAKLLTD
jgi:hypothetical protein